MNTSKRILVTEILKLAGISDPRTLAGLAALADMKLQVGPSDLKMEPEKLSGFLQFSVDDNPLRLDVTLTGKAVEHVQAFLDSLVGAVPVIPIDPGNVLIKEPAPGIVQTSPSAQSATVGADFLSPNPA